VIRRVLSALGAVCLLLVQVFTFQRTAQAEAGRQRVPVGTPTTTSPSRPFEWSFTLDEGVRLAAYHFKWDKDGTYVSPAWIRNAEARIGGRGLQMKPRRRGGGPAALAL